MIQDCDVPTADPNELIEQYTPLIQKTANRYRSALERTGAVDMDDLLQAGRIAIAEAQKHFDPDSDASFKTYAYDWIRSKIRRTLGFNAAGELPPTPVSLDTPANADQPDGESLMDTIPDPAGEDPADRIADADEQEEIRRDVHAAVDRLPSEKSRAVINGLYFDGSRVPELAQRLECSESYIGQLKQTALRKLQQDQYLRRYKPDYKVGVMSFRNTHTSSVERTILWLEQQFDNTFGTGAFMAMKEGQTIEELCSDL